MAMQKQSTSLSASLVCAWALAGLLVFASGHIEYIGMHSPRGVQQHRKSKISVMAGGSGSEENVQRNRHGVDPRYFAPNYGITGDSLMSKISVMARSRVSDENVQRNMDGVDSRYVAPNYVPGSFWSPEGTGYAGIVAGAAVVAITLLGFAANSKAAPTAQAVPTLKVVRFLELPTDTKQQAPDGL